MPWYVRLDRWIRHNPELYQKLKEIVALAVTVTVTLMFVATPPETFLLTGLAVLTIAVSGLLTLYYIDIARIAVQTWSDVWLDKDTKP